MNRASEAKTTTMSKASIIAILVLTLLVFIGGDIEGVYISTLFGLRLVVILQLPVRYYLPAALLEAAMVSINPGYGIYNFLDPIAYQAHLIGIAMTYLSAWFLLSDLQSSAGERPAVFPRYILFIGAVSAVTIIAMLTF